MKANTDEASGDEISRHEVAIFQAVIEARTEWLSSREVAQRAKVAERTARHHLKAMAAAGLLELAAVFPGNRYRYAAKGERRNAAYVARLRQAAAVLGVEVAA